MVKTCEYSDFRKGIAVGMIQNGASRKEVT
jgi:hypothetical protein